MNKAEQKFVETLSELTFNIGELKGENKSLKLENKFLKEQILKNE